MHDDSGTNVGYDFFFSICYRTSGSRTFHPKVIEKIGYGKYDRRSFQSRRIIFEVLQQSVDNLLFRFSLKTFTVQIVENVSEAILVIRSEVDAERIGTEVERRNCEVVFTIEIIGNHRAESPASSIVQIYDFVDTLERQKQELIERCSFRLILRQLIGRLAVGKEIDGIILQQQCFEAQLVVFFAQGIVNVVELGL